MEIPEKYSSFIKFAWAVLGFNILVILWGAYVRATGSGAGCGSHWPLCNGEILPREPQVETLIEFSHRLSSGLAFILVFILLLLSRRLFSKGDPVRLGAMLSFVFIITEALIGAGLVLFNWVAQNASLGRAISIVAHLINTFILLGCLTLTAWWASGGKRMYLAGKGLLRWLILIGLIGMIILGMSGALTALGDTLFPADNLRQAIQQDFSSTAHFLVRLRILHPMIAVIVSSYLIVLSGYIRLKIRGEQIKSWSRWLTALVIMQLGAGVVNVALLAPVWMQLIHLLLADAIWIALILVTAVALGGELEPGAQNIVFQSQEVQQTK